VFRGCCYMVRMKAPSTSPSSAVSCLDTTLREIHGPCCGRRPRCSSGRRFLDSPFASCWNQLGLPRCHPTLRLLRGGRARTPVCCEPAACRLHPFEVAACIFCLQIDRAIRTIQPPAHAPRKNTARLRSSHQSGQASRDRTTSIEPEIRSRKPTAAPCAMGFRLTINAAVPPAIAATPAKRARSQRSDLVV
jgi:hypothetical protein